MISYPSCGCCGCDNGRLYPLQPRPPLYSILQRQETQRPHVDKTLEPLEHVEKILMWQKHNENNLAPALRAVAAAVAATAATAVATAAVAATSFITLFAMCGSSIGPGHCAHLCIGMSTPGRISPVKSKLGATAIRTCFPVFEESTSSPIQFREPMGALNPHRHRTHAERGSSS
jgi:hypothetical protein